ncbi:auxin efflux carrier [Hymenopellis radicata]|nr:auxin efflux carrier [Hymenopellis radicata]
MGFSVGFLIYSGVMPLVKMFITIFLGFWLSRRGLFPPSASRGASQVAMNISLPGLIFSSVVPAFTSDNVSAMGPLFLQAFFYMGCGCIFGIIIREVCYVPRNFWQGIIVACAISNWGNLPTAIVLTVTKSKPFNADTDPALGVSFVAIFIVSYNIIMWVVGAANSLAWDFAPGVPQGEDALVRVGWREKPVAALIFRLRDKYMPLPKTKDCEKNPNMEPGVDGAHAKMDTTLDRTASWQDEKQDQVDVEPVITRRTETPSKGKGKESICEKELEMDPEIQLARRASRLSATSYRSRRPSASVGVRPPTSSLLSPNKSSGTPSSSQLPPAVLDEAEEQPSALELFLGPTVMKILRVIGTLFSPITMTMYISLICALIPQLKALFVKSDTGPQYHGPDGNPPLTFVIQTAELVGNINVPLALILLGASFARMQIPKPLSKLPIPAILAVTLAKLAILPVIGFAFSQGLVSHGLVSKDALVERFVGMLLSGTPTAVNQLIVSQLYSKEPSDVDTLCAFLLVQYAFMFISTAVIIAISLSFL